jgi:hypothetical protein
VPRWPAIGALLARFPALRLATPAAAPAWKAALLIHGLAALPVAWQWGPEPASVGEPRQVANRSALRCGTSTTS